MLSYLKRVFAGVKGTIETHNRRDGSNEEEQSEDSPVHHRSLTSEVHPPDITADSTDSALLVLDKFPRGCPLLRGYGRRRVSIKRVARRLHSR